jgi:hypothetical protein
MQLALSVEFGRDDQLIFAQQLGADAVTVKMAAWDAEALRMTRHRVEQTGLTLAGVEGLDLGLPAATIKMALEAAATASIDLVCARYGDQASQLQPTGRGQALVAPQTESILPDTATLAGIVPDGVRLALASTRHSPAPPLGIDLDIACLSGPDVDALPDLAQHIFALHVGNRDADNQAFLDEGEIDLPRLLYSLEESGFNGPVRAAPPPGMEGDEPWGYKGRAFDLGYLRAIIQTIRSL